MGVSKIIINNELLLDLTGDTVTPTDVREGVIFHGADGEEKTGTMSPGVDVSGADAAASDVLSGKKFVGANGALETGAMTNHGAVSQTLDGTTKTYTVPAGYHDGTGTVSVATQTKSATPSSSAQTISPDSGKLLSSVSVAAIPSTYKRVYSGSVTASSYTIAIDVGVTLSDSDVFILFATEGVTSQYCPAIFARYSSSNMYNMVCMYSGINSIKVVKYPAATVSYSGTTVTVTSAHTAHALNTTYQWYIIKA